ncbi:hypothetical protein [Paenibacillus polysaccharolyticus]|uniref:hypothetical protein n=1 Tax=Paenibacillus polysaccharolyticus TaxID=582692 RepID=UPI00280A829C|nr:hypothetical protein [Paenibacillus polysaccharolyticus]
MHGFNIAITQTGVQRHFYTSVDVQTSYLMKRADAGRGQPPSLFTSFSLITPGEM